MKFKFLVLFFSLTVAFSITCKKEESDLHTATKSGARSSVADETRENVESCNYPTETMPEKDKLLTLISQFIGESMSNVNFKNYLIDKLYIGSEESPETSELFLAEAQNDLILQSNGTQITIKKMFENWLNSKNQNLLLLDKLCTTYSETVISLPWWIYSIATTKEILKTKIIGSAPDVFFNCNGKEGVLLHSGTDVQFIEKSTPFKGVLPFYVKPAEMFVKKDPTMTNQNFHNEVVKQYFGIYPNCTISQSELNALMKTINCSNLTLLDLKKLRNFIDTHCTLSMIEDCTNGLDDDGDGLIDGADPDCKPKEICNNGKDDDGDGLIDGADPDCPCIVSCERDCKLERNFFEGMRFAGPHMFNKTNQSFSEGTTTVAYEFFGVAICNPQVNMAPCPINTINNTVITLDGTIHDFWLSQKFSIRSDDKQSTWPVIGIDGVVYIEKRSGQGFCDDKCWYDYWKMWPKYFDTKVPYITNHEIHWNGDIIGDRIKFACFEQDESALSVSYSSSVTSTVSQNMTQTNMPNGENNGMGNSTSYSFNTGISNTSSITISRVYQKDIFCGEYNLFYCDPRINNVDPWNPSGVWYGHIPNNYPGVPLYNHFNYE